MRYYSTHRPVAPGTFPKPDGNKVIEIVNFDKRQYCREAGRDCWGYIEYEHPLSEKQAVDLSGSSFWISHNGTWRVRGHQFSAPLIRLLNSTSGSMHRS